MKYTHFKTLALTLSVSALLALTGCGDSGIPHNTQLVGTTSNVGGEPIENKAPIANAGPDQTVDKGTVVTLDASASSDEDGNIVSYQWKSPNGLLLGEGVKFELDTSSEAIGLGTYTVGLVVTDDRGAIGVDAVAITIGEVPAENIAPAAVAGMDKTVDKGAVVLLDASASSDEDGEIVLYQWKFLDGTVIGEGVKFQYDTLLLEAGTYNIILFVKDDQGGAGVDSLTLTIIPEDKPTPTPTPGVTPTPPPSNQGTKFHTAFMTNYSGASRLALYISSTKEADVSITLSSDNSTVTEHITAGVAKEININTSMMQMGTSIENKMIEISSTENIVVVGLNQRSATTDAFLALPDQILSNEYYAVTYDTSHGPQQFSAIAIENDTTVNYRTPSGTEGSVVLNKGETYQYQNSSNLTGTYISSDKNIAVHSGNVCTNIPRQYGACDHIVEQMLPVNTWEKEFITVPLATRKNGDTFRFVASVDGTEVKVNGAVVATLNAGGYHEMIIAGSSYIEANNPILAVQYSNSSSYDGVTSDPFMALVPAISQYDTSHIIQTPNGFTNYINIVVPTANIGDILLDGVAIASSKFTVVAGNPTYSTAQIQISQGSHSLISDVAFSLLGYGFASYDSYGYPSSLHLIKH